MKIQEVKVWKENLELSRPYSISYKTVDYVENAFVEILCEDGLTGIGSSNPSKQVVGESVEDTMRVLDKEHTGFLIGKDITQLYELTDEIFRVWKDYPGARAALDIAVYDAFTKHKGIPLVKFLGQKIKRMATSVTIGIRNVEDTLTEAKEYFGHGFKILKVKLGRDFDEDIERLAKLREVFKENIKIRVDANQGYSRDQLLDFFKRTDPFNLELIEQPMPADDIEAMRSLTLDQKKIIAADESLKNADDADSLVKPEPACGIFNIKLMKSGGISEALKIAEVAHHSETDLMWGCNDESKVSISAALHTAFSCSHTKFIDLDGSFDLAKDIVQGGFELKDGYMNLTDKPGLGVDIIHNL